MKQNEISLKELGIIRVLDIASTESIYVVRANAPHKVYKLNMLNGEMWCVAESKETIYSKNSIGKIYHNQLILNDALIDWNWSDTYNMLKAGVRSIGGTFPCGYSAAHIGEAWKLVPDESIWEHYKGIREGVNMIHHRAFKGDTEDVFMQGYLDSRCAKWDLPFNTNGNVIVP